MSWSECDGEVFPQAEDCTTLTDDDCDGYINQQEAGCLCLPGTATACYSGPPGTEDVGQCRGGITVCEANGTAYGVCVGDVLPNLEDCSNNVDDDCDGEACGEPAWVRAFGSAGTDSPRGVAVDPSGNIILVGKYSEAIDFGLGDLTSNGSGDIFVAKFDPLGVCLWSYSYGGAGDDTATAVAVGPQGEVAVTGWISGAVDFGAGALAFGGQTDPFIARFDASGQHVWSTSFQDGGTGVGTSVAITPSGDVLMTGRVQGALIYDGGSFNPLGADLILTKYDSVGNHLWTKIVGDASSQEGQGVVANGTNDVFLLGVFAGSIDLGSGSLVSAGDTDVLVARLDASGNHVWSKRFGSAGSDSPGAIGVDHASHLLLTGGFVGGQIDFGGASMTSAGSEDIFVVELDQGTGAHVWSRHFGDGYGQTGHTIAVDDDNSVLVGGHNYGTFDAGGSPVVSSGDADGFLTRLGPSGSHGWSRGVGGIGLDDVHSVAIGPSGMVVVTGIFQLNPDFGLGPLPNQGGVYDIFLASFYP